LDGEKAGCLGMDDRLVVIHELGSYCSTICSECQTFRTVGLVISFGVDALDNIVGTLFAYAGTGFE
jgi:hypothetical protein